MLNMKALIGEQIAIQLKMTVFQINLTSTIHWYMNYVMVGVMVVIVVSKVSGVK